MTPDALDGTIAVILLLSALVAYFRGLIREVFTIGALIVASGASYFGGPLMIPPFEKWLHVDQEPSKLADQQAADAVSKAAASGADASMAKTQLVLGAFAHEHVATFCAFASVFIFFYLVMSLIGYFLARTINEAGLGLVDRLLGAGFGFIRGFLLVFLVYVPISLYFQDKHDNMPAWATNSVSVPILEKSVVFADNNLGLTKLVEKFGDDVVKKLKDREAHKQTAPDPGTLSKPTSLTTVPDTSPMNGQPPPDEQADQKALQNELTDEEKKAPK